MKAFKLAVALTVGFCFTQGVVAAPYKTLLGAKEAAVIVNMEEKGIVLPDEVYDHYNDFVLNADNEELKKYVKERKLLNPKYNPLKDCHNPELTLKQFELNCS